MLARGVGLLRVNARPRAIAANFSSPSDGISSRTYGLRIALLSLQWTENDVFSDGDEAKETVEKRFNDAERAFFDSGLPNLMPRPMARNNNVVILLSGRSS